MNSMLSRRSLAALAGALALALAAACGGGGSEPEPAAEESAAPEPAAEESAPSGEAAEGASDIVYPTVEMQTSLGLLTIEVYPDEAPKTVENFLSYVNDGFFDGTIFHRVVPGFVIQGGGFTPDMTKKETQPPIENEADNGLRNLRGTICMARTNDPHSATSQFFINTKDNPMLDHQDKIRNWGYAVFGKVTTGLDVVDAIEAVDTGSRDGYQDVPLEPVVIESARVVR